MRWTMMLVAAMAIAPSSFAAPHVQSVAEREIVIGHPLTVRVAELRSLDCKSLVLFIDGMPLRDLRASCTATEARFELAVTRENAGEWRLLFGRARGFTRRVSVGVGPNDEAQLPTDVLQMPLRLIRGWRIALVALFAIIAIAAIVVLRRRTNVLTNLPRLQIAFFLAVVGVSYGYLWATTGEVDTLNLTAFALLGIGAGTAIGNAVFGSGKPVSVADAAQRIANVAQSSGIQAPAETQVTFGLHSLQAAACTIIFGLVFLFAVYRNAEMPEFGTQELLLLGISGGTYIAFAFAPAGGKPA
jgi:hypothetical protein